MLVPLVMRFGVLLRVEVLVVGKLRPELTVLARRQIDVDRLRAALHACADRWRVVLPFCVGQWHVVH